MAVVAVFVVIVDSVFSVFAIVDVDYYKFHQQLQLWVRGTRRCITEMTASALKNPCMTTCISSVFLPKVKIFDVVFVFRFHLLIVFVGIVDLVVVVVVNFYFVDVKFDVVGMIGLAR